MKKTVKVFCLVLILAAVAVQPLRAATHRDLAPVPAKYKDLFVFKAERNLKGATVQVLTAKGAVVTSQTLQKRKVIIDFGSVKQGMYTVRISKGDVVKELHYNKK
jgi:hypothetical protein